MSVILLRKRLGLRLLLKSNEIGRIIALVWSRAGGCVAVVDRWRKQLNSAVMKTITSSAVAKKLTVSGDDQVSLRQA